MKQDIRKKIGRNARKMRLKKRMTQGDVCRITGMDRSYISSLEAGRRNPTIINIQKITSALGISMAELLK